MRQVTQECKDLAQRILAYEAGGDLSATGLAGALDRACDKLYQHLAKLIGPAGVQVLMSRAFDMAAAEHPYLEGVLSEPSFGGRTGGCLAGLPERSQGREPEEVYGGLEMILASIIWLLTLIVGDHMAKRLVEQVWAELPPDTKATRSEEEHG